MTSERTNRSTISVRLLGGLTALLAAFCLSTPVLHAAGPNGHPAGSSSKATADDSDGAAAEKNHPLVPALRYARGSLKTVQRAEDYEAVFLKYDIVKGRVCAHTTYLKYRTDPMSVYLKFKEPHEGREVIFVKGKNGGKLLAHEAGLASIIGTVALLPTSPQAMSESKHPITEIGMAKLVQGMIARWEENLKYGETEVRYFPEATHTKLGKQKCLVIQVTHPKPRKQFEFAQSRLWIERESNLPVRVAHWGFASRPGGKKPLLEEYSYRDVKLNVGLSDIDFDTANPNYGY